MRWLKILGAVAVVLGLAFLLLRAPDTDVAPMRAKYGGPPSQFVTLDNGITVHLRDEGPRDAPVVLLLHGSNADLHTWQPWTEALRARYRIVRYDQRGHGLTGPAADSDYRTEAFAADVEAVAKKLGLTRFVLGGNSMGGGIAARYAMDHPERLAGLVLVDAGGAPVRREGGGNLAFTLARMPVIGPLAFQFMPRGVVEKSLSQSVANQAVVTPAAVDRYWELARYPGNREATITRFAQGWTEYSAREVAKIAVPTLVMWGEKDALIPLEAGHWYARTIPGAQAIFYRDIGHIPMEENAAQSARDVARFMDGLAACDRGAPQRESCAPQGSIAAPARAGD